MKSAAAIVIDGVLRKPVGGTPIPEGIALYHGLCATFNVILLRSDTDDREFELFALSENLMAHGGDYKPLPWPASELENRRDQVARLRAYGYAVGLVVEPDPEIAAELFRWGLNILHFMHAAYARPDWRPDFEGGQRPWDELVTEQQHAAQLRAADARMGSTE